LLPNLSLFTTTQFLEISLKQEKIKDQVRILDFIRQGVNENGKVMIVMYHRLGD